MLRPIVRQSLALALLAAVLLTNLAIALTPPKTAKAAAPATETINVEIKEFRFVPETIKVKPGTKVIWTNKDSSGHTVTSDKAGLINSPLIKQNATFEFTFSEGGTIAYHCEPHPFMKGSVEVEAAAPATTVAPATSAAANAPATAAAAATAMPAPATTMVADHNMTNMPAMTAAAQPATTSSGTSSSMTSNIDNGQMAFLVAGVALVLAAVGGGFFLGRAGRAR